MSAKSKSGLPETPGKTTPATPKVIKPKRLGKSETDSPSPLQSSRLSTDQSPRSINSKPTIDRRSPKVAAPKVTTPKVTTPPEKPQTRLVKGSELQAQLNVAQEDLKKTKEQIALIEKEKEQAIEELKEAKKAAEEANEKLQEAIVAQKRAEEDSEIEKFRAVELEQAGIEASQKKEEEWQKELEAVRNQHAVDVAALLSATQELQKAKHGLAMTTDAKNQALSHADDATKIAEIHAEKVEILSAELTRLKALLDSKIQTEASESNSMALKLTEEIDSLKQELGKARDFEDKLIERDASIEQLNVKLIERDASIEQLNAKLIERDTSMEQLNVKLIEGDASIEQLNAKLIERDASMEQLNDKLFERDASIEQLNVELEAAMMAESYARNLAEEWKGRVEEFEMQVEEANKLERSASESLGSVMKQLEGSNDLLHDAENEIASLKEKVGLLEMTIGRQKADLEESLRCLSVAKEETSEMAKSVDSLKSELEAVKEEKVQALNNEKLAASSVESLLAEKNKLINELENAREEEEKSKKAMESLASALHEVSAEARESKEQLLSSQVEHENYETQIEDLRLVLKATNEKYETMLDDAKHETDLLKNAVEEAKNEFHHSKSEWEGKEEYLLNCLKKSEDENSSLEKEIDRLVNLLKQTEEEACTMREEEAQLKDSLKEVEAEVISLQEALVEAKRESMKLKESLLDKENELQNVIQENEEVRTREALALEKVEELSKLLEEAMAKKQTEENGELTDSEKDYDLLPKVVEFSEENGHAREEKLKMEIPLQQKEVPEKENSQKQDNGSTDEAVEVGATKTVEANGKAKEDESKDKEDDSVEVEFKMWESCKIEKKEFSPEREPEQESFEEEVESKAEGGDSFDQINGLSSSTENVDDGGSSPSKQQQQKKKKKPLLGKFGNLLKKKASSNQK